MSTDDRRQRVEDACAALFAAGQPVTFDDVASLWTPSPSKSAATKNNSADYAITTSAPAANPSSATVPNRSR